jgi:hypothetical protein
MLAQRRTAGTTMGSTASLGHVIVVERGLPIPIDGCGRFGAVPSCHERYEEDAIQHAIVSQACAYPGSTQMLGVMSRCFVGYQKSVPPDDSLC